jgi:xanthine dehydrogenase small subunit
MEKSVKFLANDRIVDAGSRRAAPALDFIRDGLGLKGAKEGCREGDCGACSVLVGTRLPGGGAEYRAAPSCLLALGELEGRHLVTIEGLASAASGEPGSVAGLTPVMKALLEENGSQCGFCSPGVVISLTGWLLSASHVDVEGALTAVEGNLCRCTGYGAIRRAAARLAKDFAGLPEDRAARLAALEKAGVVPTSLGQFSRGELLPGAAQALSASLAARDAARIASAPAEGLTVLGGGTDFFVRNPDPEAGFEAELLDLRPGYSKIERTTHDGAAVLEVGAAVTVHDFFTSTEVRDLVPGIGSFEGEMASSLIRGRATLGGNVANASPIADMTAILVALDAELLIEKRVDGSRRGLLLARFFLGYKKLDLGTGEFIAGFRIPVPPRGATPRFNFEKVAKRRHLDIASVNSAAFFLAEGGGAKPRIASALVSAGGVAATPLLLSKTSAFLAGKTADAATAREAAAIAVSEIAPISDVRGSADYRRRLLERLVLGHFIRLFPESGIAEELFP